MMNTVRVLLLRTAGRLILLGASGLFLAGTLTVGSGDKVAGLLPPGVAVLFGALAAMVWFVFHLLRNDAVKPKRRRRPRKSTAS